MVHECLGVDIGGVIISKAHDNSDTSFFSGRFLETPPVLESLETLARLGKARFGDAVHLVSKCGPRTQEKTLLWLAHHRFSETTGIAASRVHFCRQRQEKAPICAELGITHFIDDRLEVLSYLTSVGKRYLFMPTEKEVAKFSTHLSEVVAVRSWSEIASDLLA